MWGGVVEGGAERHSVIDVTKLHFSQRAKTYIACDVRNAISSAQIEITFSEGTLSERISFFSV